MHQSERILKIGYVIQSPNAERCAFEKTNENLTECERPGYVPELWRVIGDYFHVNIEMYPFNGYGIGSPNESSTIFRALVDGIVDATGPDSSFLTERIAYVPKHSSPMGFNNMVAIIKRRPAATGANDMFGLEKRTMTLLTIFGLFMLLYVVKRFILRQSLGRFSIELINLFAVFYWIFVMVCMNYIASDLSIALFDAAPSPLPFQNFEQMVETVEEGKLQLVVIKGSATEKTLRPSLEQAKESPTAMNLYMAAGKGRIISAPNIEAALEMILANDKLVFAVDWLNARSIKDSCKYELIVHETFPTKQYGFFYSNSSPEWFELDEIDVEVLSKFMERLMDIYYSPHECFTERSRKGLKINQLQTLFYFVFVGAGAALIFLGIERIFALKVNVKAINRRRTSSQFHAWLKNFPNHGPYVMQYAMKDGSDWYIHIMKPK